MDAISAGKVVSVYVDEVLNWCKILAFAFCRYTVDGEEVYPTLCREEHRTATQLSNFLALAEKEKTVAAQTSLNDDSLFYVLSGIAAAWGLTWIIHLLVITH